MRIIITPGGTARCIYNEAVLPVIRALGKPEVRRASHVEPTASLSPGARYQLRQQGIYLPDEEAWWADMTLSGGPVLGPFFTRSEALKAEVQWLQQHRIG